MKDYLKAVLTAGVPFGLFMGMFVGISNGIYAGLFGGIVSGFLFGSAMSIFISAQKKKFKKISAVVANGKDIIYEGAANHLKGAEGVGGWLYLTPDELIFKSHAFNIQKHVTIIPLNKIESIKDALTMGFIPSGLQIKTTDNIIEKFVVNNRKVWVEKINQLVKQR